MSDVAQNAKEMDLLIERMHAVRSAGHSHVDELQDEAKRLIDWKEYVLTKPLVSVVAASLMGFLIARSTSKAVLEIKPRRTDADSVLNSKASGTPTLAGGFVNLATSIASSAVKSYVAKSLQRIISERSTSDRFQKFDSKVKAN